MRYEICVSQQVTGGHHLHVFATHERSIMSHAKACAIADMLRKAFPASKGYKITCTQWQSTGNNVNV